MGKKSSSPPPAPDLAAAAREQGAQNILAAEKQADLSRINQYGPQGSQTWSMGPDGRWGVTTSLSPEQQKLYDQQTSLYNQGLGKIGELVGGLGTPLELDSLTPSRVTSVQPANFNSNVTESGVARRSLDFSNLPGVRDANLTGQTTESGIASRNLNTDLLAPRGQMGGYQTSLDLTGLPELPGTSDFSADRQNVTDAMYRQATSSLDPFWQAEEQNLRTRLTSQGVREGSEAWNREWDNFNRARTAAYGDARDRSILAGGQEQSRLASLASGSRNQLFNEILGSGQFGQQGTQLQNALNMAVRDQDFNELLTEASFGNAAAAQALQAELAKLGFSNEAEQQRFINELQRRTQAATEEGAQASFQNAAASQALQGELARLGFGNEAEQQRFLNDLTNANLTNSQRDALIQEMLMKRQVPMQELATLLGTAGTYQNPQFGPQTQSTQGIDPTDILGSTAGQYQMDMDRWNAEQASKNAKKNNIASLGSAAIGSAGQWGG